MTDRDTFAAAALTGLLARPDIDEDPLEWHFLTEHAYRWADAMLRERDKSEAAVLNSGEYGPEWKAVAPNNDAAPAARAMHSRDCSGGLSGTGDIDDLGLLRRAVRRLLDGINERHPEKNPREWVCQDMALLDALVPPDHDAAPAAKAEER